MEFLEGVDCLEKLIYQGPSSRWNKHWIGYRKKSTETPDFLHIFPRKYMKIRVVPAWVIQPGKAREGFTPGWWPRHQRNAGRDRRRGGPDVDSKLGSPLLTEVNSWENHPYIVDFKRTCLNTGGYVVHWCWLHFSLWICEIWNMNGSEVFFWWQYG